VSERGSRARAWLAGVLGILLLACPGPAIELLARSLSLLLDGLLRLTGGAAGWAIVLLALAVRLACLPLLRLAERWQREVDAVSRELAPRIAELRARCRGEERGRRVLELYRAHGVHPLHGLKSLLGVAIQIPIFVGAYHALDGHAALRGAAFLWVDDLARPDRVASLPFALPLLGDGVHLLPILMAGAALLASRLHGSGEPALRGQRMRRWGLYGIAASFFVLLYTFPAGVVLYWTTGSLVSLARAGLGRRVLALSLERLEVRDDAAS